VKTPPASLGAPENASQVAPLLPATAPMPEPARRVNFFKALLLYWLLPGRYGPHLAAGSFLRAYLAHGVAMITALAILGARFFWQEHWELAALRDLATRDGLYGLRIAAAEAVVKLAIESTSPWFDWTPFIVAAAALPAIELGLPMVAILLMPWCAGGDRAGSVFRRSLKNVCWASTLAVPLVIVVVLLSTDLSGLQQDWPFYLLNLVFFVFILLLGRALLVGAGRYVGKPEGPAFGPREPRCDDCGYLLIGLPLETRCPECGLAVRESLPGGRRRPKVWQLNQFRPRGFLELIRLQWKVLRNSDFFKTLPVQEGFAAARHFWWGTWLLMLLLCLGGLYVSKLVWGEDAVLAGGPVALLVLVVPIAMQAVMMFTGCLYGQIRCGIRDYRVSAIACYYASPLIWPLLGVLVLGLLLWMLAESRGFSWWVSGYLEVLGIALTPGELALLKASLVFIVGILPALLFWWVGLRGALRAVRYANV
jgi:hypothetical protein